MDVLVTLAVIVFGYLLPSCIASARSHQNGNAILMLNLFLGWTFIGWVVALVWSFTSSSSPKNPAKAGTGRPAELNQAQANQVEHQQMLNTTEARLAQIAELRDRGVISKTEYDSKRTDILQSL